MSLDETFATDWAAAGEAGLDDTIALRREIGRAHV